MLSQVTARKKGKYTCRCVTTANGSSSVCNQSFPTITSRTVHMLEVHRLVPCAKESCGQGFASVDEVYKHMKHAHSHLCCGGCTFYSHVPNIVVKHRLAHHANEITPTERARYECPKCHTLHYDLHGHFATAHTELLAPSERSKYWCEACRKYVPQLSKHQREVHTDQFVCPLASCHAKFSKESAVSAHLRNRHSIIAAEHELVMNIVRMVHSKNADSPLTLAVGRPGPEAHMEHSPLSTTRSEEPSHGMSPFQSSSDLVGDSYDSDDEAAIIHPNAIPLQVFGKLV
ncbi:Zinc finger C2H2 type domain [Carpediemonas membranifera]|uniref:Zinc finger C2H2 type domain n=1 Tax=Carpediemonas membranifera TaxID=201153 RepID=A0A8J6B0K5_9EUKA|nr:Zinc finger C2H2 type domain [Carpediemonas membranifera]|eukprot:KAG9390359.1 Zinc finger C2H2 type domain [Carpediemonas membranifera]